MEAYYETLRNRLNTVDIYVYPAMADDGLAIGSAILTALDFNADISWLKDLTLPYFGDSYSKTQIKNTLKEFNNIIYEDLGENWPKEAAISVSKYF